MLRVALTGGIGSGKTAVSDYLETLGVTVLDADRYAHQVTARGQDAVTEIATAGKNLRAGVVGSCVKH